MKTGKERYEEFIHERKKQIRTATAVWVCMLLISVFCTMQGSIFGEILAIFGVLLAVVNMLSYWKINHLLDQVDNREELFQELEHAYVEEERKVMISDHYVILRDSEVKLYCLADICKVEVGIQDQIKKTIFLTDHSNKRHAIFSCFQNDGRQEAFDKIYHLLREKVR